MLEYLKKPKSDIDAYLESFLESTGKELSRINGFGPELAADLFRFTSAGKTIRGGLLFLAAQLCGGNAIQKNLIKAGAAIELLQSGLLIHDDIMDRDIRRRGQSSIHALYSERFSGMTADYLHLGESLGICAGDITFFYAFELLSSIEASAEARLELLRLFSREMLIVGTAQMQDVVNGSFSGFPEKQKILDLYTYKTGRYTFSLPLMVGAILAQADHAQVKTLEKIGEMMGIVFQIRDDYLGVFGDPEKTGKPVGSDLREGKKTLQLYELRSIVSAEERDLIDKALFSDKIDDDAIQRILDLAEEHGLNSRMSGIADDYKQQLEELIVNFPGGTEQGKKRLRDIYMFIASREK